MLSGRDGDGAVKVLRKKKITVQRCRNELWVAKSAGRAKVPEYHLQQNNRWRAFHLRFQTFFTWQLPNSTPPGPITARRKHLAILSIRILFPPLFSVRSIASLVFPTAVPDLTAFPRPLQLQLDCDLGKLLGMRVHVSICSDDTNGVDCHHSAQLTTVMGD